MDRRQLRSRPARARRHRPGPALAVALLTTLIAGCSSGTPWLGAQNSTPAQSSKSGAAHGPDFPVCGGVSDETVARVTGVSRLPVAARNSVGCQWVGTSRIRGPLISFTWFRGSPIGRERKSEELSRTRVSDITVDGHSGFIAVQSDARLGEHLCDIGIQYSDDFFEWSVQFIRKPFPNPCDVVTELSRRSIAAAG